MSIILDRDMADEVQALRQPQLQPEPRLQSARRRSQTSRLERSVNACQRCRGRKQKCDLQYPKCGSCVRTNSRCLIYDSSKGAEVPRDYVQGLESELSQLKKELEELRAQKDSPQSSADESHHEEARPDATGDRREDDTELVVSMARVALGSTNEPRFMGTSSGVTLAKLVMAAIKMPHSPSQPETFLQLPTSLATVPSSLPPSHVASHLLDIYFKYRTPFFIFLSRADTESSFRYVYENHVSANNPDFDQERMNRELFLVYMVISIGLIVGLKHHSSSLQQSEGCFNSALKYIDDVLAYRKSNLETLSSVLLLAQYIMMCPAKGSLWQISGVALRLCIDLGLHWESASFCRTDPVVLDTRRRLFWTTYKIERLLSITLGRPFGIVDQSINVGMPSVMPNSQPGHSNSERSFSVLQEQVSNHLTLIFQLESEIKHVLYHQCKPSSLAFPRPNWKAWYPVISRRLEDWVAEIPCDRDHVYPGHSDAWWNSLHSNALLLLHRPSPAIPHPPTDSLIICSFAARKQILSIRELYREKEIDVPWIWVHRLFLAGLTTTYCLWHSSEVREQTRFEDLMETMQACSSVLSALAERFPGASGCRDSFDRLSAATLKHFTTNDRPLSNKTRQILQHTDFGSLTGQFTSSPSSKLPVSMVMETPRSVHRELFVPLDELHLDNVFLFDDMDLGETLSSTAQWPGYPFTDYFGGQE